MSWYRGEVERQKAEQETMFRARRMQEQADVAELMTSDAGRRVILRVLRESGCLNRPVEQVDPALISFHEGRRSIGFDLFGDVMEAAPSKFIRMIKEEQERLQADQLRREQQQGGASYE